MINLETLVNECTNELASIGLNYGGYPITWARRKSTAHWAVTHIHKSYGVIQNFSIEINPVLKDASNIHEVKDTILHEMLHTFPDSQCHTGKWKANAQKVNSKLHYNIERCGDYRDFGFSKNPLEVKPNYRFICSCGQTRDFVRRCDMMDAYIHGLVTCSKCGSKFTGYKLKYN